MAQVSGFKVQCPERKILLENEWVKVAILCPNIIYLSYIYHIYLSYILCPNIYDIY